MNFRAPRAPLPRESWQGSPGSPILPQLSLRRARAGAECAHHLLPSFLRLTPHTRTVMFDGSLCPNAPSSPSTRCFCVKRFRSLTRSGSVNRSLPLARSDSLGLSIEMTRSRKMLCRGIRLDRVSWNSRNHCLTLVQWRRPACIMVRSLHMVPLIKSAHSSTRIQSHCMIRPFHLLLSFSTARSCIVILSIRMARATSMKQSNFLARSIAMKRSDLKARSITLALSRVMTRSHFLISSRIIAHSFATLPSTNMVRSRILLLSDC